MTPHLEQRLQQIAAEKGYHPASEYMDALRLGAKEAICENVPEGCTPADARVLREANHALADEVARAKWHKDIAEAALASVEKERDTLQARVAELEAICENVPEGCTPADARVLREANHALAAEVARLRLDVQNVVDANEEYHDDALALEKERDGLRARVGELIHYPDCWDQICYPTIERALENIDQRYQGCTECAEKSKAKIKAEAVLEACEWLHANHEHLSSPVCGLLTYYANQIEGGE